MADSLLGGIGKNNEYTFELVRRLADDTVLIPEDAIAEGMAHLYRCHRMVVEGAAAVGVGALLRNRIRTNPENRIVVVVSGNNVDLRAFEQAISPFVSSA